MRLEAGGRHRTQGVGKQDLKLKGGQPVAVRGTIALANCSYEAEAGNPVE